MKRISIFLLLCIICIASFGQYSNIKKLGMEQGLSSNFVMGITQDEKGFIWVATESGLNKFDGKNFKVYKKNIDNENSLSGNELNGILCDKNTIWIATQRSGLNAFDCNTMTFSRYVNDPTNPQSIATNDITDIAHSKDGNLWISSYYNGFSYFNKETKAFRHYNISNIEGLGSNRILSIQVDVNGKIYLGHESKGLSIVDIKSKKAKNFKHDPKNPNSLPGDQIKAIRIDQNGYVWLGSNNGLCMFNPESEMFTTFKHSPTKSNSLLADNIFDLLISSDQKLWVGTENGGISILDLKKMMFITPETAVFRNIRYKDNEEGISNSTVRCIFEDSFHNIWIGTYGGGVNFISNIENYFNKWIYSPIPGGVNNLSNKVAWGICSDAQDNIWIGTDGGGIDVFENGINVRNFSTGNTILKSNAILSAIKDSNNNLWFGTYRGGLYFYDSKKKQFEYINLDNNSQLDIRCLFEDRSRNLFIGTHNGLFKYNLTSKKIDSYYAGSSSIHENDIRSITQDDKGNYWIGTYGNGIGVYNPDLKLIKLINNQNGLFSNTINNLYKASDHTIWAATGEGLIKFENSDYNSFKIFLEKDGLPNNTIKAITEDKNNMLWFSSNGGITRYAITENRFYNYNHLDGVPMGDFMGGSVTSGKDGTIFFGSQDGICYFNPSANQSEMVLPPTVITEFILLNKQNLATETFTEKHVEEKISLSYSQNSFKISFNELNFALNDKVEFAYQLKGLDNNWYNLHGDNSAIFRNLAPGTYEFEVKARLRNTDWPKNTLSSITIDIAPPFWLSWWAKLIYLVLCLLLFLYLIKAYKRKLKEENALFLDKQSLKREQDLNNEKLRFYTNVTHELRTPLTLISGPLEDIMSDSELPKKFTSKIKPIIQNTSKLLDLVNQILEFRKIESQNKRLCVSLDNMSVLIREIGEKYKDYVESKGIAFEVYSEDQVIFVFDAEVVITIVENLVSNAVKYTDKGFIKLTLNTSNENGIKYVNIEVEDTGYGISEENQPRIFDRYYQVESNKHTSSGTGIGLALVESLVKLHDAEIFVSSTLDVGSKFKVRFRFENEYPDAIYLNSENKAKEIETEFEQNEKDKKNKILILVVEDNIEIQEYIKDSLADKYNIETATNGKSGIDEAFRLIPDVIISDITMPIKEGVELCKTLKEDIRTSHIPIILLTAKDSLQDKTTGYSLGADSYITKPFNGKLLLSRVENLIEKKQKTSKIISLNTENKRNEYIESLSNLDNEFLKKVTDIIIKNLDSEKIDVVFLADQMNMSHSSFYRKIKALTGMTANEFLRKIKIRNAEELLITGKYTISEVAYSVGMSSMAYFRQCFKEEFGISPSEYLKQLKK